MKVVLAGLPKSGRTSVFEAVTQLAVRHEAQTTNVGTVDVPDERLDRLFLDFKRDKKVHAKIEYVDPYVPERGADEAVAAGLNAARDSTVLGLVIRAFENPNVPHVKGSVDPRRDVKLFTETMFELDRALCNHRIERIDATLRKAKSDALVAERDVLVKCKEALDNEAPLLQVELRPEQRRAIEGFQFLTRKPLVVILNVDEEDAGRSRTEEVCRRFQPHIPHWASLVVMSARLERELVQLASEDRAEFMNDAGIEQLACVRTIKASYEATDTVCFFTVGKKEVRAWPIKAGTTAQLAAGTVHTDMMRGFIRAEVLAYKDYISAGSMRQAKAEHLLRLEGKDYVVQDGDIIYFRFHV